MDKPIPLAIVLIVILLTTGCSVPASPIRLEPSLPGPTASETRTAADGTDQLLTNTLESGRTVPVTQLTPAASPSSSTPMPPREETPRPESPLVALLGDQLPPQPTPEYLGELALPLPQGVVEGIPPPVSPNAAAARLLYLNGTLHVWHVDEGRDQDLGWPAVAIDCPWLASDGHTLYFSDEEGAKRVDLADPQGAELILSHFREDENEARHRTFCVQGESDDGQRLLIQARDQRWYQWGVLDMTTGVTRVVESPFGPPGEPWHCPGAAVWGQDSTLLLSGYSAGDCNQFPGLHKAEWGAPLVPTPVLTSTLPHLDQQVSQKAGAWYLTRSPSGQHVAFWFDLDWVAGDAPFFEQALYVVDGSAQNPRPLTAGVPGGGGPPAWSEDGSALYYAVGLPFNSVDLRPWQVVRVAVAEGAEEVVAEFPARQVLLVGPTQGNHLLLLTLTDDLTYAARVLDLESGEFVNGPAQVTLIGWLP